jgi:hypothetical protein
MNSKKAQISVNKLCGKTLMVAGGCVGVSLLLGAMLLTTLLISGTVEAENIDIGTSLILMVSIGGASLVIKSRVGEGRAGIISIFVAAVVVCMLILNMIIIGWQFQGLLMKLIALLFGGAAMMVERKGKIKKRRKWKNR